MTQYQHGFPQRNFTFARFIITDFTKSKTRYYDLIRLLCLLFNCRCLRDEKGMFKDFLYIVGRNKSVAGFAHFLRLMIIDVENEVEDHRYYTVPHYLDPLEIYTTVGGGQRRKHKSSYIAEQRVRIISDLERGVKTIISLKKEFYYDKYAFIRKVKENEIMDTTFFSEYIRENKLTHLKPFSHAKSSISSSTGKT